MIRPGETFLGVPFAKLKVGSFVEEETPDKGKLVGAKPSRGRRRRRDRRY